MTRKARPEGQLWQHWANLNARQPKRTAVTSAATGKTLTVSALTESALAFSDALLQHEPGTRIAFRLPNGAEWFALFLALQRAGLAAMPLDGGLPVEGCVEMARLLGASALYVEGAFQSLGKKTAPPKRDHACCIKITSGTGALPKTIPCRAEHLLADGRNIIATMGLRPRDINLAAIPLGHSYGLGNLVLPLIMQGTAVVCASEYLPRQLLEWIARHRVTVFPAVPALFRVLAAIPEVAAAVPSGGSSPKAATDFDSLRTVISAGAVLNPAVAQAFFARFGRKIHNFYGSSETGGICYDRTGTASLTGRSVGQPLAGVKVTVKAGAITIASPAVATRGGRWRVPDSGEWNARGELVLLGRAPMQANIGGKKVHPLEVERVLRALPGVTDVLVWLEQNGPRDLLAAGVETAQPRAQIEQALASRLPAWKCPKTWIVVREFPRTGRGKLDLAALKQLREAPGIA
jgi:acyl-CoA synthetase (AMP-forming)/AMP-acid ligase II